MFMSGTCWDNQELLQDSGRCVMWEVPLLLNLLQSEWSEGTKETAEMRRGSDMEFQAAKEYAHYYNVNYSPCGLVSHSPRGPMVGHLPWWPCLWPQGNPIIRLGWNQVSKCQKFCWLQVLADVRWDFQTKENSCLLLAGTRPASYYWSYVVWLLCLGRGRFLCAATGSRQGSSKNNQTELWPLLF